jgi:hypothetical protein
MPVYPVVDSSKLREVAKRVREIEPQIRKDMIDGLKADLKPYAEQIKSGIPGVGNPPLSGFKHSGRTRWGSTQVSVYVTPGGGKGSVARIEVFGRGEARAGFKIVDLAGTSNYTETRKGEIMNARLAQRFPLSAGGKGGRFAWAGFMKHRPAFLDITVKRLNEYADRAAGRLTR